MAPYKKVKLSEMNTAFWRFVLCILYPHRIQNGAYDRVQAKKPTTHLATVEAIYHFFRQAFSNFFPRCVFKAV